MDEGAGARKSPARQEFYDVPTQPRVIFATMAMGEGGADKQLFRRPL